VDHDNVRGLVAEPAGREVGRDDGNTAGRIASPTGLSPKHALGMEESTVADAEDGHLERRQGDVRLTEPEPAGRNRIPTLLWAHKANIGCGVRVEQL